MNDENQYDIALVGCGSQKFSSPRQARRLYTSTYFKKKRRYAELGAEQWYILSAKHGLVGPQEVVSPYDVSIGDLTKAQRDAWADSVCEELAQVEGEWVVLLAGSMYTEPLRRKLPFKMDYLFENTSGIGEQLSLLTNEVNRMEKNNTSDALVW